MPAVFRHQADVIVIGQEWTERVKASARSEPLRRSRLNIHHDESDQVQEMLVAFCEDSLVAPHRHIGKTESFHMIEGRLEIVLFDDDGNEIQRLLLGAAGTGLPTMYRLSVPFWHLVIPLDEMVVVHEITTGPFFRESTPPPAWVPRTDEALQSFARKLRSVQ